MARKTGSHGPATALLVREKAIALIAEHFSEKFKQDVLTRYPRQGFNQTFTTLLRKEAKKHPHSRTALLNQLGLPLMIKMNAFAE